MSDSREILFQAWTESAKGIGGLHLNRIFTLKDGHRDEPAQLLPVTGWLTDPNCLINGAAYMDSVCGRQFEKYWQDLPLVRTDEALEAINPSGSWAYEMAAIAPCFAKAAAPIAWSVRHLFPGEPNLYTSVNLLSPPYGRWMWEHTLINLEKSGLNYREHVVFVPYDRP